MIEKDTIVSCPTKADWEKVVQKMLDEGNRWPDNDATLGIGYWNDCKANSCVSVFLEDDWEIKYASKPYYKKECPNIPIISAQEFLTDKVINKPMTTKDKIIKILELGFYVPVRNKKTNKYQIISPFKDEDGDYRCSDWCDSLERCKQLIGNFYGYPPKDLEVCSKDWEILTPIKEIEKPKTFKIGDKARILDTIEETEDWKSVKDKFPKMRGEIDRVCIDAISGVHYRLLMQKSYGWWINAKYLVPDFDYADIKEKEEMVTVQISKSTLEKLKEEGIKVIK